MGKSGEKWLKMDATMIFRGRFSRNIDPKGRLILPPEIREAMASQTMPDNQSQTFGDVSKDSFILTTYDKCLVAYSLKDWMELEEKFMRIPNPSPRVRAFRRLVIGGAEIQRPDSQGRILLSPDHRAYACLDREATVLGQFARFEIWNPSMLQRATAQENIEGVSDELAASGINFEL